MEEVKKILQQLTYDNLEYIAKLKNPSTKENKVMMAVMVLMKKEQTWEQAIKIVELP